MLILKIKLGGILLAKSVLLRVSLSCTQDMQTPAKTIGNSAEQGKGTLFHRGKGEVGKAFIKNSPLSKLGAPSVGASYWLSCDCLSLFGLLLGKKKIFLPPAWVVKYYPHAEVCLFFLDLQLMMR